jgi:hypothetical protein
MNLSEELRNARDKQIDSVVYCSYEIEIKEKEIKKIKEKIREFNIQVDLFIKLLSGEQS